MSDKTENVRKPASATDIRAGNAKMRAARKRGNDISKKLGEWSGFRAMQTESGGSASEAEKLRKYRAMSTRIGEDELKQITNWCIDHERAWGPTLLCELSRIPRKKDRQRIAKDAIKRRLGLVELKRIVRLEIDDLENIKTEKPRVGRPRKLDWTIPKCVLDEIRQVCGVFLTFAHDIHRVAASEQEKPDVSALLKRLILGVDEAKDKVNQLQTKCIEELKKLPKA